MFVAGFVGKLHRYRILHIAGRGPRARGREPKVADEIGLAAVEYEIDRIDRHDGRQQRRPGWAAGDQVAGVDAPIGNASANGSRHIRPLEIEFGLLECGIGGRDRAGGIALIGLPRIELALSESLVAYQRRGPLDIEAGDLELGLRAFQIRLSLLDREPIRPRIDDEQRIALLDDLAVLELDGVDKSGHPRTDLDGRGRHEPPGVFVPLGDLFLNRQRDCDGWSWRGSACRRGAATAG